jgi:sodium/bile acid cotransporter 7
MRSSYSRIAHGLTVAACLFFPLIGTAGENLTDEQKKEIVYQMYRESRQSEFPNVSDLMPSEANKLLQEAKVVFVDVRKKAERDVSTLPGAVPADEFLDNPDAWNNVTVVVYCTISHRSGVLAEELAERGISVLNLRGGILAWALEGYPVFDDNGETRRIHVYGSEWDYAPAGYETVRFGWFRRLF